MLTEKLAREKEVSIKNIEEALSLVNSDFLVEKYGADLKEVEMSEDGQISSGGISYPITDWAFESLCSLLRIPKEFARRIPVELFLENLNRLKVEHNQRIVILVSRNIIINVVPHPYIFAENRDILKHLDEIMGQLNLELHEIRLSDRGMDISFLKEGVEVEPVPGDITRFGINVLNSETGFRGAKACFWLLRLVCTNGATLTNNWGKVNWSYDQRISYERSLYNFFEGISKLQVEFSQFSSFYKHLPVREVVAHEYINIWRRLSRIVGNEMADRITMVDKEERNRLNRELREGNRMLTTGLTLYDLYNSITEAARRYPFVQRRKMEGLGGSLIDLVSANDTTI